MTLHTLNSQNTVLNKFIAQIRDKSIQTDSMRFRRNLERIGEITAYEITKELSYTPRVVETPLGEATVETIDDRIVVATILRAGLPYLLKVALPAGAAQIVWQSGYLMLFVLVASLPFDSINALAGLTAGLRIEALLFLPGMAFNMSVSVLVGNCLGMGEPAKAKRVALQMIVIASLGMSVVAALLWPFRAELAALLSHEAGTQAQIINYLTYNLLSTPFSIASTVMGGVMVGAGATRYNLMVYGGTFWLVRLPLGWLLGHWLWGTASGVFLAMLVSQCLQTAIMFYVLLYRDWARFAMRARHHHDNR